MVPDPQHILPPGHLPGHDTDNTLTNPHPGNLNLATPFQARGNTVAGPSPASAVGSPMASYAAGWHWERDDNHL